MTFHNIQNRKTFYNNNDPYCVYDKVAHFVVMWLQLYKVNEHVREVDIRSAEHLRRRKFNIWLDVFPTQTSWKQTSAPCDWCCVSLRLDVDSLQTVSSQTNKQTNKQSDAAVTVSAASSSPSSPAQLWLEEAAQRPESTPPGARGQSCLLNFTERRFL